MSTTTETNRPGLNTDTLALAGVFIAMFAFIAALIAVGLAARAIDEHEAAPAGSATTATGSSSSALDVELREFAIGPTSLDVPAEGATLEIRNTGAVTHNLSVDAKASEMLQAGQSTRFDLRGLAPGTYKMQCDVPGHAAAGMVGTVTVG